MDCGRPRARRRHVPLGSAATRRLYFQSGANRSCCMTTFVLLHGGGMGGWTWKYVRPLLQKAGHEVLSPTFTGFGERIHLISRDISNSRSEEHTSELQSLMRISYAVFCLKKK